MRTIYFSGNPCHTYGEVPVVGSEAPEFLLTDKDLKPVRLSDYRGRRVVLNVFPSLDTPVCAASVRRFNKEAADLKNTTVICISMDLPFAMKRFCTAEGIDDLVVASAFRAPDFARDYGLKMTDGPLEGLLARAVLVIDEKGRVVYSDVVEEITNEPDYNGALSALK
ncbi:MAG: thiol peroxidase [Muribaculaceae bacterium]|jgi:thiol peroxidase